MSKQIIPSTRIAQSIYLLRGQKVMLDFDLATLYGVETKVLNQSIKRNATRFPNDFAFQLTAAEMAYLRSQFMTSIQQTTANKDIASNWSQFVTSSRKHRGATYRPYAFTEQGVAMLSSVLKSERIGERTRLACWRWRPRHRELALRFRRDSSHIGLRCFSARRRKEHARRVCSPTRNHR